MSSNDEYTDYSCSTSVERLTRDVEDVLRSWHLSGSDRHVSFHASSTKESSATKKLKNELGNGTAIRDNSAADSEIKSSDNRESTTRDHLLRTQQVRWVVPLEDGEKVELTLKLDLWDGPTSSDASSKGGNLPFSLRRPPLKVTPVNVFCNLSTVFGIGQHITLSLTTKQQQNVACDNVIYAMGKSIVQRHSDQIAPWVVLTSLSRLLQTSLQCATSNIACNIPAFGIWGTYHPVQDTSAAKLSLLLPTWMQDCSDLPSRKRTSLFRSGTNDLNQTYCPPLVLSNMLTGTQFSVTTSLQNGTIRGGGTRLTYLSQLLLHHCNTPTVVLCGATHIYTWRKPPKSSLMRHYPVNAWRQGIQRVIVIDHDDPMNEESIASYQEQSRQYAASLIERFSGASISNPLWGPLDDPIGMVHVMVTWDPKTDDDDNVVPLLTLPLKVRSKQEMTESDWLDMEESMERAILDPLGNPASFSVNISYDAEAPLARLASTQRLLLASLIRATTLPETTLLHQLTDEVEMDDFNNNIMEDELSKLVNRAGTGPVTRSLVDAVDWKTQGDEMIEGWEAEKIVKKIMDGTLSVGFPSPPDQVFVNPSESAPAGLFAAFSNAAPTGRLLSNLFVHMARLRSPASMALVWTYFVHDLRNRFYSRTSLPNMGYVPGIDPPLEMLQEKSCFSSSGLRVKATNAAFVHCSEPQPDSQHCLIGQKLQVFNICIESLVAAEIHKATSIDRSFETDYGEEEVILMDDGGLQTSEGIVDHLPKNSSGSMARHGEAKSVDTRSTGFFDAEESGSNDGDNMLISPQYRASASHTTRQGARCPVFEAYLENGEQLYAPYLSRPIPWTDDLVFERHCMLSARTNHNSSAVDRLEIMNRFLKPELLSDMRSFQAANTEATYNDFLNWYGEPGNALDQFDKITNAPDLPVAIKLDKAAEVMKIMTKTRNFWRATWEEAIPAPATSQPPLFDVLSTVEMVLDFFENLHPASLLNQVMAVNLSASYFALVSDADEAMLVTSVKDSLSILHQKMESALELLARDAKHATRDAVPSSPEHLPRHASLESIRACEESCNALSDSEALLSRATSLLHKFPKQYEYVELLLTRRDNRDVALDNREGRVSILDMISKQQKHQQQQALPSRRAYILRNTDPEEPCQLCVRCAEDDSSRNGEKDVGMLLALTKTCKS